MHLKHTGSVYTEIILILSGYCVKGICLFPLKRLELTLTVEYRVKRSKSRKGVISFYQKHCFVSEFYTWVGH